MRLTAVEGFTASLLSTEPIIGQTGVAWKLRSTMYVVCASNMQTNEVEDGDRMDEKMETKRFYHRKKQSKLLDGLQPEADHKTADDDVMPDG